MSSATKRARERLLDEIMTAAHEWHRREGVAMQSGEDMRRRIAAGLAAPDATAEDLASDVERARVKIDQSIRGLRPEPIDSDLIDQNLRDALELLRAVPPYLRGADFSDRIPPTFLERVAAVFRPRRPA